MTPQHSLQNSFLFETSTFSSLHLLISPSLHISPCMLAQDMALPTSEELDAFEKRCAGPSPASEMLGSGESTSEDQSTEVGRPLHTDIVQISKETRIVSYVSRQSERRQMSRPAPPAQESCTWLVWSLILPRPGRQALARSAIIEVGISAVQRPPQTSRN